MTHVLFSVLIEAPLRALAAAAAVWLALRLFRVDNVRAQKTAWTLMLAGALAMPLLMRWQWLPAGDAIELPSLARVLPLRFSDWQAAPALAAPSGDYASRIDAAPLPPPSAWSDLPAAARSAAQESPELSSSGDPAFLALAAAPASLQRDPPATHPAPAANPLQSRRLQLVELGWLLYLAVAAALLLRLATGLFAALRVWLTADPVSLPKLAGLAPSAGVRCSRRLSSPANFGSAIVLPADYRNWSAEKLRVVIAHEREHVRQADFYLQLLAGLYAALVWFSPLGWWLRHKLSELGEAMGDRAGLEEADSPSRYAQMLLEFAALPRPTHTGVAMARTGKLASRIERLLNDATFHQAFTGGSRRAAAALAVAAAALLASAALVRVQAAAQAPVRAAQTAPAQPPAAAPDAGVSNPPAQAIPDEGAGQSAAPGQDEPAPAPAPSPDAAPTPQPPPPAALGPAPSPAPGALPAPAPDAAPAPPVPPQPGQIIVRPMPPIPAQVPPIPPVDIRIPPLPPMPDLNVLNRLQMDALRNQIFRDNPNFPFAGGDTWALVPAEGEPQSGMFYGGHQAEIDRARKTAHAPFLWFRHDGKSYIVEDPSLVAQVETIEKPAEDLRSQMRALDRLQRALGEQLRQKVRLQRQATVPKPDLSRQMAALNSAVDNLKAAQGDTITQAQLMKLQMQIAGLQAQVARAESGIYRQSGEWNAFGRQMGQLGAEQGRLVGQMVHMSLDNQRKIDAIISQSLHDGKAKPIR